MIKMISKKVQERIRRMDPDQRKLFNQLCKLIDVNRILLDKVAREIWPVFGDDEMARHRDAALRKCRRTLEKIDTALNKQYKELLK